MSWSVPLSTAWLLVLAGLGAVSRPRQVRAVPNIASWPAPLPRRQLLGAVLRRLLRRPPNPQADLAVGTATAVVVPLAVINPTYAVGAGAIALLAPMLARRRARMRHRETVIGELPEVIDLLRLSLAAGGSVRAGIAGVGAVGGGPVATALSIAGRRCERGLRLADALESVVSETSGHVRPLVRALSSADHYGTELTSTLGRLAAEARATRRRRAQSRARTVPVRLLLPLVVCNLPAFVLLTLVPTLAETVQGVRFA